MQPPPHVVGNSHTRFTEIQEFVIPRPVYVTARLGQPAVPDHPLDVQALCRFRTAFAKRQYSPPLNCSCQSAEPCASCPVN